MKIGIIELTSDGVYQAGIQVMGARTNGAIKMARETARHWNLARRLTIESLERRELLCGSAASGSSSAISSAALRAGSSMLVAHVSNSHASASSSTSTSSSTTTSAGYLFTTLTDASGVVVGTASFETVVKGTTTTEELLISVAGAAANASYTVTADSTTLGTLTTDANGNGHLLLTSTTDSSGSTGSSSSTAAAACRLTSDGTLPDGFTLAAGATLSLAPSDTTLDTLSGTFATASGAIGLGGNIGGCHGDENATISRFDATLTEAGTTVGRAVFTSITAADGTTTEILRVHLKGADASTTFDVSIDGTSVGSITTNANGDGFLILSSNPKSASVGQLPAGLTVTSSSTMSIGTTISGPFSTSSSSDSGLGLLARHSFRRR